MQRTNERSSNFGEIICKSARSWIGTPYHHMGRIKGAGVDCAMFPLEVYREAGLIGDIEVPYYTQDWMLHRSKEIYLHIVQQNATERPAVAGSDIETVAATTAAGSALPGDFVLYCFGRCWSHGAIVIEWPLIIHAVVQHGVILSDGEKDGMLVGRRKRFFRLTGPPATAGGTDLRSRARTAARQ